MMSWFAIALGSMGICGMPGYRPDVPFKTTVSLGRELQASTTLPEYVVSGVIFCSDIRAVPACNLQTTTA